LKRAVEALEKLAGSLSNTSYGEYLEEIASEESDEGPKDRGH